MTDGEGRPYSPTFLRSITNQMSAIMNHAVRLYGLRANPMHKVERIGSKRAGEMLYWTKEEYLAFSREVMDKPDTASERLYFALNSRSIADGLEDQLDDFAEGHEGTGLVIVDTLQKVRAPSRDSACAADYGDVGALKGFADSRGLAVLAVHHTRKMGDADVFNTVSGTTGITGSADSTFVLAKQSRSSEYATLSLTGRDVEFQELKLRFNDCSWELIEKTSAEELAVREGAVLTLKRIM